MKTKAQHTPTLEARATPTPWRINYGVGQSAIHIRKDTDFSTTFYAAFPGQHVMVGDFIQASVRDKGEAEANAALIVRAVNSHASLVEALREADDSLEQHGNNAGCWPRNKIRAALALAECVSQPSTLNPQPK